MDKVENKDYVTKSTNRHWYKYLVICLVFIILIIIVFQLAFFKDQLVHYPKNDVATKRIRRHLNVVNNEVVASIPTPIAITYNQGDNLVDTNISSLIEQFSKDYVGTYSVSMVELSGMNRSASYDGSKVFYAASTYKLFAAYSTLIRVESGDWDWSDYIVDDKDLSTCFYDMIAYSDNNCAEALIMTIGAVSLNEEAYEIGCINTTFADYDAVNTTADDLALFLKQLQLGQILSLQSSRDRLINAMKDNIYRLGVPAGISGAIVADKVGFMDNLLHDASIVYSPTGTYVLVIMTDGSNWEAIASMSGKIEEIRTQ